MLDPFQIVALLFLAPAIWIDHRQNRIPNIVTGSLLVTALVLHVSLHGWSGLAAGVSGLLVGLGIFLIPYVKGGMAAGDVKLMAAVGACLGPLQAFVAGSAALIVGGSIGMALMTYRYYRSDAPILDVQFSDRFPFASSIAIGTAAAIFIQGGSWTL
jgi:prepilin peptidase CpaA